MGLLRTILALAVVATHSTRLLPFSIIPGGLAVQSFYIISGFYMAFILTEKYLKKPNAYKLFITNRILRIYPIYFLVLALTVLFYTFEFYIRHEPNTLTILLNDILHTHWWNGLLIILMSLFIFGQDTMYFTGIPAVSKEFLIPQAWTLSLELMFYLLVFFLIRQRLPYLGIIFVGSLCLRASLAQHGFVSDAWNYQFFPHELALFLAGIFSFKIFERIRNKPIPAIWNICVFVLIITLMLSITIIPYPPLLKAIVYFMALTGGLPFIFYLTKNSSFDRWIGDFSYPIYISHFLIKIMVVDYMQMTGKFSLLWGWWVVAGSVALSFLLLYAVIYPLDKIREGRVLSHKL